MCGGMRLPRDVYTLVIYIPNPRKDGTINHGEKRVSLYFVQAVRHFPRSRKKTHVQEGFIYVFQGNNVGSAEPGTGRRLHGAREHQ